MKNDSQLKQDVVDELAWDPEVSETEVGVEVKDGIVTLAGHLDSYAAKRAAERAVQRVFGVKGVAVEIDVALPGESHRNDADIARTVQHVLAWNAVLPKERVKLMVENGWVTLTGDVDHGYQRMAAENAVFGLMGVKGVSNQIVLKPVAMPSDVKGKIEAALQRRAHREAIDINVSVNGDQVTLNGFVGTLGEHDAAIHAVLSTHGVASVVDKLRVV